MEDVIDTGLGLHGGRGRGAGVVDGVKPAFFEDSDGFFVGFGVEITGEKGAQLVGGIGEELVDGLGLGDAILGDVVLEVGADEAQWLAIRSLEGEDEGTAWVRLALRCGLGVGQGLDEFVEDGQAGEDGIAK